MSNIGYEFMTLESFLIILTNQIILLWHGEHDHVALNSSTKIYQLKNKPTKGYITCQKERIARYNIYLTHKP